MYFPWVSQIAVVSVGLKVPWICTEGVMPQLLMFAQHLLWIYRSTRERQPRLQQMNMNTYPSNAAVLFFFPSGNHLLGGKLPFILFSLQPPGLNPVSSVSDRCRRLTTSRGPGPKTLWPFFFTRSWSEDEISLVTSYRWPVPRTESPWGFSIRDTVHMIKPAMWRLTWRSHSIYSVIL